MPRHAVETGHVDFILPPAEIATTLLNCPHCKVNRREQSGDLIAASVSIHDGTQVERNKIILVHG
jgi:hypothetical protein